MKDKLTTEQLCREKFQASTQRELVALLENHFGVTLRRTKHADFGVTSFDFVGITGKRIIRVGFSKQDKVWKITSWSWNPDFS